MKNDEWSLQVNLKKTDSETGNPIAADAQYEIYQSVSYTHLAAKAGSGKGGSAKRPCVAGQCGRLAAGAAQDRKSVV